MDLGSRVKCAWERARSAVLPQYHLPTRRAWELGEQVQACRRAPLRGLRTVLLPLPRFPPLALLSLNFRGPSLY